MAEKTPRVATIAHISHKHALAAAVATIIEQQRNPPMTKPSREDFERVRDRIAHNWQFIDSHSPDDAIILEALRIAAEQGGERQRVRHKKRGSTYQVVGVAELQVALPPDPAEGALLVIYQSEHDGKLWARRDTEFNDGRFEHLPRADHSTATPVSGWRSMDSAPRDGTQFLAVVNGLVRFVAFTKTSHVPLYGFCLVDQGPEECEICEPDCWMPQPLPSPPGGGA